MKGSRDLPTTFFIRSAKIVGYLLNLDHHRGRSKAKFFLSFGFSADDPQCLADALIDHAVAENLARESIDDWGHRVLEFEGAISALDGQQPRIKSVWIFVEPGAARLVTAHPLPRGT